MARRKRVTPGDVLEVKVGGQLAYLHYIGKHPEYGDAVVVHPVLVEQRAPVAQVLSDGYVTFYPVMAAAAQELVAVVGNAPPPPLPRRFRRPGAIIEGQVKKWIIEDGNREILKDELSEEELMLPIAGVWNHEYLVQRLEEGWRPELVSDIWDPMKGSS